MQIFVTSPDARYCAQYLDDKRVIKQILETAQLISSVMILSGDHRAPYKLTHQHHPCTKWLLQDKVNQAWIFEHFQELCLEYTRRFERVHACYAFSELFKDFCGQTTKQPESFANVSNHPEIDNTFIAYQLCLAEKWFEDKREPRWYRKRRTAGVLPMLQGVTRNA